MPRLFCPNSRRISYTTIDDMVFINLHGECWVFSCVAFLVALSANSMQHDGRSLLSRPIIDCSFHAAIIPFGCVAAGCAITAGIEG